MTSAPLASSTTTMSVTVFSHEPTFVICAGIAMKSTICPSTSPVCESITHSAQESGVPSYTSSSESERSDTRRGVTVSVPSCSVTL